MNPLKNNLVELQYQFSKLFVLGIPRRKFEYEISANRFSASITSRNTIISLVFTAFASLLLPSGIIELYVKPVNITTALLASFVIHTIISVFGFRQFLWLVNGTEKIIIENNVITLEKHGTFLVKSHPYQLDKIDFIQKSDWNDLPVDAKLQFNIRLNPSLIFRMTAGEISFNHDNKEVFFFSNLLDNEKLLVVDQLVKFKHLSQKTL